MNKNVFIQSIIESMIDVQVKLPRLKLPRSFPQSNKNIKLIIFTFGFDSVFAEDI